MTLLVRFPSLRLLIFILGCAFSGCVRERIVTIEKSVPAASTPASATEGPRKKLFTQVTDKLGPLVVNPGTFHASAKLQPWSGWWYPKRERTLFDRGPGLQAPLQKYDAYVTLKSGQNPGAAAFEEENIFFYNPGGAASDGLCDALSGASLLEAEPLAPLTLNGIHFEVQDLKALLIKTYENLEGLTTLGERNNNANNDFQDLYPDQFHRFIQHELLEHGRPFYYDRDPSSVVWNTPVYRMDGEIVADPSDAHLFHVDLTLVSASPFVDQTALGMNYVGRLEVLHHYTYDLLGDEAADGFHVRDGAWTADSVDYHPDFVTLLPNSLAHPDLARTSGNPRLDTKIVDEILSQAIRRDKW